MRRELKGRIATQAGEASKTAHCPKLTAMATMMRLMTAMVKNDRSHFSPFRKRLMSKGAKQETVASNQATASGEW